MAIWRRLRAARSHGVAMRVAGRKRKRASSGANAISVVIIGAQMQYDRPVRGSIAQSHNAPLCDGGGTGAHDRKPLARDTNWRMLRKSLSSLVDCIFLRECLNMYICCAQM